MAKLAPVDDTAVLGDSSLFEKNAADLDLYQEEEIDTKILIDAVKECEDSALSVKGITNSEGAGASSSKAEFFLATSNGFHGGYKSSTSSISCSVLAGEGQDMERDYEYAVIRFSSDLPNPKEIGQSAAEKTLKRLNPQKINSTKLPVVFDKRISNDLLGYLASSISGTSIARGTSFLKDSLGKQVFNKDVTIIDDPSINRGLGSKPFDGEGIKVKKREIVTNGKLNSWILNTSTAKKLGLKTTGNASRSVGSPPGVSTSNLYMTNGRQGDEAGTNYTQCFNDDCTQSNSWSWDYAINESQLTSAIAMQTMRSSVDTDDVQLVYALSTPYTVTLIPPTIDISFGTRSALGVQEVSNSEGSGTPSANDGKCSFYPEEPIVTITIN